MKPRLQKHLRTLFGTIIYWFLVILAYDVYRRLGIENPYGVTVEISITRKENFLMTLALGLFTGLLYYFFELIFDTKLFKRKPVGLQIIAKMISYFTLVLTVLGAGIRILGKFYGVTMEPTFSQIISSGAVWSFIIYFVVASIGFTFLKLVDEKFGPGTFWKILLGQYQKPKVEKRIFMFLDLKSSTLIAEQLGYKKYSALIQQCFYDLNDVIQFFSGEIYQYVGDEVVVSWDYKKGTQNCECVDLFFQFRNRLHSRRDFYMEEFGIVPEFKAGLHGGKLMAAEVGVVKREIAYHGDVINTTARIQSMCNELGEPLLISEPLLQSLKLNPKYLPQFKGEFTLKGKEQLTSLHSVCQVA